MKIYDDVLDKHFLDYINKKILDQNWAIHYSHPKQKTPLFFNSIVLHKNIIQDEFAFLLEIILSIIKDEPEIKGKVIQLERGYINLYPYGIGGDWHIDSDTTNGKTLLFYPYEWKEEYGGATEFQESGEIVEYKKNRLLIFNSELYHRAAIHQNPKNRYTIAFKIFVVDKKSETEQTKAA